MDVVVIGAGQAGLSAAYHLRRNGYDFQVVDHSPEPGGAWQFRWPTLTFETVHGIHRLPGSPFTQPEDVTTPVAEEVPRYFGDYEQRFELDVARPVHVAAVRSLPDGSLRVETDRGTITAKAIINATGTWDKPFWPYYRGRETFAGRQLHTADYRGPDEFAGLDVVVVGGGASGMQHLLEIAEVARSTHWVTRREPVFFDHPFDPDWGRRVVAAVDERVRAGLPPESVIKATGYRLTPELRAASDAGVLDRLPMFDRITPDGVAWDDGRFVAADAIVWATGFRAALDHLAPLRLRNNGGGITVDGTRVVSDRRVHLVGYGPSASTVGANRAGGEAVRELRGWLRPTGTDHRVRPRSTASARSN
ncbi:FAD-dependent oxidoreductase [Stackebrandtia soli]|uniref:FAD-dependent oxidoreductase n=1 Tax=Stackebrandtia soli TaxID=1892856 RepID=UPI0039E7D866